jgi:hypothetical protein
MQLFLKFDGAFRICQEPSVDVLKPRGYIANAYIVFTQGEHKLEIESKHKLHCIIK